MSEGDISMQNLTSSDDWSAKATRTVVGYVDKTKQATTGKALVVSRAIKYLVPAAFLATIIAFVGLILAMRLVTALFAEVLPFIDDGEVWLTYLVFGTIFLLAGFFMWSKAED